MPDADEVTRAILMSEEESPAQKVEQLLPVVYQQLRAAAQQALANERPDHTLEATGLVHEAYLRLVGDRAVPWANRAHFYVAAAEAMRRVLIDHARARGRVKRGGDRRRADFDDLSGVEDLLSTDSASILALDDAIRRLEGVEPEAVEVLRLRFFAGLTVSQTAAALEISPRQVDRLWAYARAWLFRELDREAADAPATGDDSWRGSGTDG